MKRIRNAFVTGMLILVPVVATIQILGWLIGAVENSVRGILPTSLFPFDFRGLGLLTALLLIFLVGTLTQNYAGRWLVATIDAGIARISIVGGLYSGIKKFLETIFHPGGEKFKGTVLVEFPRKGIYSIGFRTGVPDPKLTRQKGLGKDLVNIFVPCTPNPTSGFYLLVPEEDLVPLDLSVQEAFKIVISMGIVTSEESTT